MSVGEDGRGDGWTELGKGWGGWEDGSGPDTNRQRFGRLIFGWVRDLVSRVIHPSLTCSTAYTGLGLEGHPYLVVSSPCL